MKQAARFFDGADSFSAEGRMNALMTYHFGGRVALFDSIRLTQKEDAP